MALFLKYIDPGFNQVSVADSVRSFRGVMAHRASLCRRPIDVLQRKIYINGQNAVRWKNHGTQRLEMHWGMFVKHGPWVTHTGAKLILEDSTGSGFESGVLCCSRDMFTFRPQPRRVPVVF
jgi:hypothetical protein